jgi:hypothetical protein
MKNALWTSAFVIVLSAQLTQCAPVRPSEATALVAPGNVPQAEWFKQTGCTDCHSISVYRVFNLAATGPDLSMAVEDVPRRFGRSLDDFLRAPTGTMSMVLSTRIQLTPEQRLVAIDKLKEAYRVYQHSRGAGGPVPSH